MNIITRGIRNAFRNVTRTTSIVLILGMSIGLSTVMLVANRAVESKIKTTLSSIGTTVSIHPAGYTGSGVNSALTNEQINKLKTIAHVKSVSGFLNSNAQPDGTSGSLGAPSGADAKSQGTAKQAAATSLQSPFKLDCDKGNCTSGDMGLSNSDGSAPKLPDNFSLVIPFVGSNSPTDPAIVRSSKISITSGSAIDGSKDVDEAMISKDLATKNNLKVGDTFTAYGHTVKVAAIFDTDTRTGNSSVIVSLATLQRYTNQTNLITNAVATIDTLENLENSTNAIKQALGDAADVNSPLAEAKRALEPLMTVKSISLYSLIGSAVAGAAIILLTMGMIVRERKREIGVLKAIGFSNIRIMLQFISEAFTFTLLSVFVGMIIGVIAGKPVTTTLVQNSSGGPSAGNNFDGALNSIRDVQASIGWEIVLFGLGLALLIAFLGSALASFFIAKVRPAEVLRSE